MIDFDDLDDLEDDLAVEKGTLPVLPAAISELFGSLGVPSSDLEVVQVPPGARVRVACISDVHVDAPSNMRYMRDHLPRSQPGFFNVLILAGDVSDDLATLKEALDVVARAFDVVCFTPGNHDLWVIRRGEEAADSMAKLRQVLAVCEETGVRTRPVRLVGEGRDVVLLPLLSWYTSEWDRDPELPYCPTCPPAGPTGLRQQPIQCCWTDFKAIKWPQEMTSWMKSETGAFSFGETGTSPALSETFARVNEPFLQALERGRPQHGRGEVVISFSHFLPRQDLIPEKRFTIDPFLHQVVGSDVLEAQIRRVRPDVHVFGHTHFPTDIHREGLRYVQWPLGNKGEQKGVTAASHMSGPLVLYNEAHPERTPPRQPTFWGNYFEKIGRDPNEFCPAPWLRSKLKAEYPDIQLPHSDAYFMEKTKHPLPAPDWSKHTWDREWRLP